MKGKFQDKLVKKIHSFQKKKRNSMCQKFREMKKLHLKDSTQDHLAKSTNPKSLNSKIRLILSVVKNSTAKLTNDIEKLEHGNENPEDS